MKLNFRAVINFQLRNLSVFSYRKNHAIKIEITYKPIIGVAKSIILGISPVGETTAATIKITTIAIFQLLTKN